jgi:hypothetical protein
MDGIDRQPAIEILSSEFVATIPFQGNSFGIAGASSFRPHVISHSTGRLGQVYIDENADLQWMYTDTERTQWTTVSIASMVGNPDYVKYVCAVELSDGNIGLIIIRNSYPSTEVLQRATITPTGTVVSGFTTIESLSSSYTWTDPYVVLLESGDYYLVYCRKDTATPAYAIYGRTGTAWDTWGSASDITPSGVNTAREMANTSLFETTEGDLFLLFDHVTSVQDDVTIKNIFSSISTDDGASFGTATARTNYTAFGSNGLDPIMVQKSNGTVWLIFYENIRVLHMDNTATGFLACSGSEMGVKHIHCDYANRKILVVYGNSQWGTKRVDGVAVVDMASWSIDKVYYNSSTPALNKIFCDNHIWQGTHIHSDGKYLAMSVGGGAHQVFAVIDHTTDSVTHYVADDLSMTYRGLSDGYPAYSLPRNIEFNSNARYGFLGIGPQCIRVDASNDRLYIGWDGGYYRQYMMFSYIDLTEAPDGEGFYSMNWVTSETSGTSVPGQNRTWYEYGWGFEIDRDRGYFICYTSGGGNVSRTQWNGGFAVLSEAADGAIVKYFTVHNNNSMCLWGPRNGIVYNGAFYGSFYYYSGFPYTDQRGLVKIDYLTDTITYHRPSFVTTDQHHWQDYALDADSERIYIASPWGMARFDIVSGAWTIFNTDTLPGFVRSGESNSIGFVAWDPVEGNVIGGAWNDYGTNYLTGINMFNENGAYNQLQYITAYKSATWNWDTQLDLSYYSTELQPSAVIDIANVLWVTWSHTDWVQNQSVLYWDNDIGDINVVDDLVQTVTLNWQLKKVNTVSFNLANGHLYDPQNLLSTLNVVGQKGRKVHVRIGEEIGGYTYWVNQGTFIVDTVRLGYKRGKHPTLSVNCTGKTSLWREQQIPVSTLYSGQMPDDVIRDIIDDLTQWLSTEYSIDVFNNEHSIFYQWIDKTIWNMVEELGDHFFYAMYEDADGIFGMREVSLTQAVDHEYTDQMQLNEFSPDDNYSDYTNRVRVIGETNDYTEVLHNEELITSRGGTVGWWTKKTTETIHFSEDDSRQCRNPRLEIIHSPKEYGLLLDQISSGKGGIKISYVDPYEKYIEVEIEVPDLTAALVGAILAMVLTALGATWCGASLFSTCGPYIWAVALAAALVFYILAAVANYQYEVWARPLGRVKTTIQYEANDVEFQRKLNGEIVTEEITDPLCNSITECRRVAEGNLAMVRAQRSRVSFRKIAHLQDELMDKLKVYHPHSAEGMEMLVVGLKRSYTKGEGVFDQIDGWRYKP